MYCLPPATGPPTAGLEEREHLPQRAAVLVEHDAGAHEHDAQPERLGGLRLALPDDADLGEEVAAGRGVLGQRLVAVRAVVADRGGADEHARAADRRPSRPATRLRVPSSRESRMRRLRLVAPALGDVLAREVDDGVAAGERLGGAGRRRVPGVRLHVGAEGLARPLGVRLSTVTSSPRAQRAPAASRSGPVAPVSVTRVMPWIRRSAAGYRPAELLGRPRRA